MTQVFTARLYVGTVPGLPGAHSQGATLDELQKNLREVLELIVEERKARGEPVVSTSSRSMRRSPSTCAATRATARRR